MKILHCIILILCLSFNMTFGQKKADFIKVETEIQEILKGKEQDTTKVNLLHKKCQDSMYRSPKVAKMYNDASFKLAQKINYQEGMAWCFLYNCVLNVMKGNYKKALKYNQEAIKIAQKLQLNNLIASAQINKGTIYIEQGKYIKAVKSIEKAAEIYKRIDKKEKLIACYINLANIYKIQGLLVKSLSYFQKSLSLAKKSQNKNYILECYTGIGNIYAKQKNFEKAINSYKIALKLSKEIKNNRGVANAYGNLGNLYFRLKTDYVKALEYYQQSLVINNKIGNRKKISLLHINIANVYLSLKNYTESEKHYKMALSIANKIKTIPDIVDAKLGLGKVYAQKHKMQESIKELESAYKLAKNITYQEALKSTAYVLAKNYGQIGDFKNAYKYQQIFTEVNNSLLNEDNIRKLTSLQKDFEFEQERKIEEIKKEKEKKLQKAELKVQKLQKLFLWIGIILISLLLIYFYYSNRQKVRKNKILLSQKAEIKLQAEELKTVNETLIDLDSFKEEMISLIAHDLKTPLNSIIFFSKNENSSTKRHKNIHQSGKQILNMVNNMLDVYKFKESEFQLDLKNYSLKQVINLALTDVDFLIKQSSLQILENVFSDFLIKVDIELIRRVFVNLLTNAIKYSPNNSNIWIKSEELEGQFIKVIIQDEGSGISSENQMKIFEKFSQVNAKNSGQVPSTGLGLTFCKIVVETHGGEIGVVSEENKGTSIWFTLPALKKQEMISNKEKENRYETLLSYQSFEFSDLENKYLKNYLPKLQKLNLHELSHIMTIVEDIRKQASKKIEKWANELENALFSYDIQTYKRLVNL